MCNMWKFNDYCHNSPNSSNDNINSFESKDFQNVKPKSSNSYYNDKHIYLSAEIQMNHHIEVNIGPYYS